MTQQMAPEVQRQGGCPGDPGQQKVRKTDPVCPGGKVPTFSPVGKVPLC